MSGQAASATGTSAPRLGSSTDVATAVQSRAATTTRGARGFWQRWMLKSSVKWWLMMVNDGR